LRHTVRMRKIGRIGNTSKSCRRKLGSKNKRLNSTNKSCKRRLSSNSRSNKRKLGSKNKSKDKNNNLLDEEFNESLILSILRVCRR